MSETIRAAAVQLVRERGYGQVSIAALVEAAGVSRQTLYNRWSTKAELVLDAFSHEVWASVTSPDLDSDQPREALLRAFLGEVFAHLERDAEILRSLIGAAQSDAGFRAVFWERFVAPRSALVEELLRDAQRRGELSTDRDVEMLSTMIHGAFWFRLLNARPLESEVADRIVSEIF